MTTDVKTLKDLENRVKRLEQNIKNSYELQGIGDWLPKKTVMKFMNYGETAMRDLSQIVKTSKQNRRTFFSRTSLLEFIEKGEKKN